MKKYRFSVNIVTETNVNMENLVEAAFEMLNGRKPDWHGAHDGGDLMFQVFKDIDEIEEIEVDGLTGPRGDLYVALEEIEEVPE